MTEAPHITRLSGALAEVAPLRGVSLNEVVSIGERSLLGEVIAVRGDTATVQVYEETTGLRVGEPAAATGRPLTAELGPGLLGSILDGVGRPLTRLAAEGDFIRPGSRAATLDPERRWRFDPAVGVGESVDGGDVLGIVEERPGMEHRVLVPPGRSGRIVEIAPVEASVGEVVARLDDGSGLGLAHRWPVRRARPVAERLAVSTPFVTGQRIFDFLFPVAEGGTVAVPGGFGTGKTVIEQSLAKYARADVVVYIGCGERGNEMAEVLAELPALVDPTTGRSLLERTVLIVNTSDMPVAARESSIDLGLTIGELYRDMGYRVAVMADSLSRWAEALREIAARMQEMPGEEGYPTYLASRLARAYERAGSVRACGRPERSGSLTFISAVSPPGGDFSEPVTQASLRVAGALWALDPALAHERQFPAVDWETSYTLYAEATLAELARRTGPDWGDLRRELLGVLEREGELRELAGLVGVEALQSEDRVTLETARIAREVVLGQNAYHPHDACCPLEKTYRLASAVAEAGRRAAAAVRAGRSFEGLDLVPLRRALVALRDAPADRLEAPAAEVADALARLDEGPS